MYFTEGVLMILMDYSQLALGATLSFKDDIKRGSEKDVQDLIRHVAISSIKQYKKRFGKEYGKVILACDGRNYWRKHFFPQYKASRKKNRDASDLNWTLVFDTLNLIREEIKENFPYTVLHVDRCEADDIIATLVKSTQEFGQHEPVMIVSSDGDFKQLQKYDNVKQFSPIQKKAVSCSTSELRTNLIEHIVKGDSGDGIPNILSQDDCFILEQRQSPVLSKRLAEFFEDGFDACKNDVERRNWHRNQTLVDFDYIPEDITKSILAEYELNKNPKGDRMSVYNYLVANRCRNLLNEIEEF
jgi:hypothetical protein